MNRTIKRFMSKVTPTPSCWLWDATIMNTGYGQIYYKRKLQLAHRVSYMLFVGTIPKGLWVLHNCDNRRCVNPNHLYVGTRQDNMDDMINRNHSQKGERHYGNKVSESDVIVIRDMTDKKLMSTRKLAKKFGVSQGAICHIIHRRTWTHV